MPGKITIDNARIEAIRQIPLLRQRYPFLSKGTIDKHGCCGRRDKFAPDYEAIKRSFASLSPQGREELKSLLNASSISVIIKEGNTITEVVF